MKDSKGETVTKEVYRQGDKIYFDGVGYGVRIGDLSRETQRENKIPKCNPGNPRLMMDALVSTPLL